MYDTQVGVDLAKEVIQVCIYRNKKVQSNIEMTPTEFLSCGSMSAVHHAVRREAKTKKDLWIKGLVERRGKKCAAVALANKTVRTAYAILTQGTEYKAELLAA